MEYCKCHGTLTLKEALHGLTDEMVELIEEPSRDELSDVTYSLNRLAGALVRKPYIGLFPYAKLHKEKVEKRMLEHGCIRSKRHLIDGKCPSINK